MKNNQIQQSNLDFVTSMYLSGATQADVIETITNAHNLPNSISKFLHNKEKVSDMFVGYNSNYYKMADELGINVGIVWNYLKLYNIPTAETAPESMLYKMLDNMGIINYKVDDTSTIKDIKLSVYLPDFKLAIEVNSIYLNSDKFKLRNYHLDKHNKCNSAGVQLLQFWDLEILNTPLLVESLIMDVIGKNVHTIPLNGCTVVKCKEYRAKMFLLENNIQRYAKAQLNYGLEYNGELVSVMTFAEPRFNKQYDWELVRLCNKLSTSVEGSHDMLLSNFKQEHSGSIITYSHMGYSSSTIYNQLGFILDCTTKPSVVHVHGNKMYRRGSNKANLENTITCYNSGNFRYIMN